MAGDRGRGVEMSLRIRKLGALSHEMGGNGISHLQVTDFRELLVAILRQLERLM